MKNNNELYQHLRDENHVPYATFAAIHENGTLFVGASRVSEDDQFTYHLGRKIASGRASAAKKGRTIDQLARVFPDVKTKEQALELLHSLDIVHKGDHFEIEELT